MASTEIARISDDDIVRTEVTMSRLDAIANGGINLQCSNSSDFTVGKQTNFNAPVTIINCSDMNPEEKKTSDKPERDIVIREQMRPEFRAAPTEASATVLEAGAFPGKWKEIFGSGASGNESWLPVTQICTKSFLKVPIFVWSSLVFLIVTACTVAPIALIPREEVIAKDAEVIPGKTANHTLYRRAHWRAAEEKSSIVMRLPVPYVVVSSTGGEFCSSLPSCSEILLQIQKIEQKKTTADIYANFLVSSDGSIYEGRGWRKRNAFLGLVNSQSIEISCIGDFAVYNHPTRAQISAVQALIEYGVRTEQLWEGYVLVPANATGIDRQYDNPFIGKNLYNAIKSLPHFEPFPYSKHYQLDTLPV